MLKKLRVWIPDFDFYLAFAIAAAFVIVAYTVRL